ncbi:hypothetical protein TcG_13487 [Trypanosoma cruzi]|nr:hypothetical protein TcG_13487 [Trypanosoma cruzi]
MGNPHGHTRWNECHWGYCLCSPSPREQLGDFIQKLPPNIRQYASKNASSTPKRKIPAIPQSHRLLQNPRGKNRRIRSNDVVSQLLMLWNSKIFASAKSHVPRVIEFEEPPAKPLKP